jgi:hypothetical protein
MAQCLTHEHSIEWITMMLWQRQNARHIGRVQGQTCDAMSSAAIVNVLVSRYGQWKFADLVFDERFPHRNHAQECFIRFLADRDIGEASDRS